MADNIALDNVTGKSLVTKEVTANIHRTLIPQYRDLDFGGESNPTTSAGVVTNPEAGTTGGMLFNGLADTQDNVYSNKFNVANYETIIFKVEFAAAGDIAIFRPVWIDKNATQGIVLGPAIEPENTGILGSVQIETVDTTLEANTYAHGVGFEAKTFGADEMALHVSGMAAGDIVSVWWSGI